MQLSIGSVFAHQHRGLGKAAAAAAVACVLGAGIAHAQAPHDARQGEQWAVADGAVLNLPAAWELAQGAGVVVAVIDSGARVDHPDLAPNIWTNFDEIPGNRVDDDDNGYVDDVHGVDLTTSSRSRQDLSDGNGHGTHVAGIIAGAANGRGVVGVAFRARLMIVKVLDARGAGTTGAVADGIKYAAANGARVINLSLGGPTRDPWVTEAVKAAADANVLLVCSAGNLGQNVDQKPSYPVALPARNIIGVAATEPERGPRASASSPTSAATRSPSPRRASTCSPPPATAAGSSRAAPRWRRRTPPASPP